MLTFLVLIGWFVDDSAVLQASQIKHSHATVRPTAYENIDAISAESNIIHLFVVGDELCLRCQSGNIPDGARCVDARGDDQTR
jgi:hypothetical protein